MASIDDDDHTGMLPLPQGEEAIKQRASVYRRDSEMSQQFHIVDVV